MAREKQDAAPTATKAAGRSLDEARFVPNAPHGLAAIRDAVYAHDR